MTRITIAYEPGPRDPAVCYALRTMMDFLGLEYHLVPSTELSAIPSGDLLISYGRSMPGPRASKHIHFHRSGLLYEDYLAGDSLPVTPLPRYERLPVIYTGGGERQPFLRKERGALATNIDIPAAVFFMLTRYEELVSGERDERGRFPASASLAFREGFLFRPVVNRYLDLVVRMASEIGVGLEKRGRWRGREFAVCLTHDVERIRRYVPLPAALEVFRNVFRGNPAAAARLALDSIAVARGARQDPYWTFDFIMNVEERHGMRSSFFIRTDYDSGSGGGYSILDAGPSQLVKYIASRWHEIGLLGGAESGGNPLRMLEERRRLSRLTGIEKPGTRQHRLLWNNPATWRAMADAGLLYDTSVAFPGTGGFRCGVCLPFRVFDVEACRQLPLWELPTVVPAAPPEEESGGDPLSRVKDLMAVVKREGGVFVCNWRNSSLGSDARRRAYAELVRHVDDEGACTGTLSGILRCWSQ